MDPTARFRRNRFMHRSLGVGTGPAPFSTVETGESGGNLVFGVAGTELQAEKKKKKGGFDIL